MEVYQVKVFLEVARHLSFTEAADALNLTQPAVSFKIKSLESELGTPLFYRLGRKIQLTEVGEFLFSEGAKLVEVENQLIEKVEEIKKGKFGNLRVGCTVAIADGWLPDIIFQYSRQYPGIQVRCIVFESAEFLYRALTNGQIDLGMSDISLIDFTEIAATAVGAINYSLIVGANHPLAKENWLSLNDLHEQSWVTLRAGSPSRLILESRLHELGLDLANFTQIETVDTIALMRTYIMQGNCLGFASNFEFQTEREAQKLIAIPLQEFAISGNIYLLQPRRLSEVASANAPHYAHKSRDNNPVQKFLSLLQSLASETIDLEPPIRLRSPSLIVRSNNPQRPEIVKLAIGIQNCTVPTVTAGLVIQKLGLLEHFLPRNGRYSSTQYQIRWHDFSSGAPIVEGLQSGQLNIGILGDYPLLLSAVAGVASVGALGTRLVSFVSANPDGCCNAVIVPYESDFESIEDFRGKAIAVPFGSSAHGMVMRSLYASQLLLDVKLTSLEQADLSQTLPYPTKLADGYAHFAPFHNIACRNGNYRYLSNYNLNSLPAFHGIVVSASLADSHPEVVMAYLQALKAAQYWHTSTASSLSLIGQWTKLDMEIISQFSHKSVDGDRTGRFFHETAIRSDWIREHIAQLSLIPGNEHLSKIDLNNWIQFEFLQRIRSLSS